MHCTKGSVGSDIGSFVAGVAQVSSDPVQSGQGIMQPGRDQAPAGVYQGCGRSIHSLSASIKEGVDGVDSRVEVEVHNQ